MKQNKPKTKGLAPYKEKILKNQRAVDEIHDQINHIFDKHLKGRIAPMDDFEDNGILEPDIEITESDKAVKVSAELPGLEPQDIEINVSTDGYMTITGEKRHETEETDKGFYFSECSYGIVQRTVPLPGDIDTEKVSAEYKNGILKIDIPKLPSAQEKMKKIPVKAK